MLTSLLTTATYNYIYTDTAIDADSYNYLLNSPVLIKSHNSK